MATQHNFRIKNGLEVAGTERISSAGVITGSHAGSIASATTATTQSASDNSTKIATTAYTDAAITALVDSSPGTLNTLNELAAALNDDASFSTTVTNSIATKLPLAGGTMTGDLGVNQSPSGYGNLTVGGTGTIVALRASSGAGKLGFYEAGAGRFYLESLNGSNGIKFMDGDGSSERMRIAADGKVSITANGATAMDVQGESGSHGLAIGGNDSGFGFIGHRSSGSYDLLIKSSGNVSIGGGTGPSDKLVVAGTSNVTGQMYLGPDSGDRRPFAKSSNWGYSSGYKAIVLGSTSTTYTDAASGSVTLSFNYDPSGNNNGSFGGAGNEILFRNGTQFATPNAADNAFNLVNLCLKDGSVGIGTASPGAKLEISGKDDATGASDLLRLQFDNSPADTGITFTDINSTIKNRISMDAANTADLRISSGTQMHFYGGTTNGTGNGHFIVNSSGHVSIQPTKRLYLDNLGDTFIMEYAANEIGFYTGSTQRVKMSGGHLYSNGHVYSGTSSTSAAYTLNSQTTHGSWGVGCHNASYAHHTTDRGIYYWNTQCQASGGFHTYSDERLKQDVNTLTGALDDVAKMNGVTFKWKDAANRGGNSTGKQFGVIAQNMLEVDSELPQLNDDPLSPEETRESDDSYYSMDYSRLSPYFIEAIKELKTKLEAAEARIATLEG